MFKFLSIFKKRSRLAEESDYGRRFGWFIERDGTTVGELEYLRWLSDSQFWHEYRISWRSEADAVHDPDAWIDAELSLRNKRCPEVVIDSFLTATTDEKNVIAVRGASVPEEILQQLD